MSLTNTLLKFMRIFLPSMSTKCNHDKIRPDVEQGYCPDCGKLIKNEWFVTRCSCCGDKNIRSEEHTSELQSQR